MSVDAEEESSLQFLSTQMQASYERASAMSLDHGKQMLRITQLQRFKGASETPETKPPKRAAAKRTRKPKRIKSITAHVNNRFGSDAGAPLKRSQVPILAYFSGRKRKVKEIIDKIESVETHKAQFSQSDYYSERIPYSQDEWNEIIRSIKLRFPHLSTPTRKTLKSITSRIQVEKDSQQHDAVLWNRASAPPTSDLTSEDIKWLYDLDDRQMQSINSQEDALLTRLSQEVFNTVATNAEDLNSVVVIADSEPEYELLTVEKQLNQVSSHQPLKKPSVLETMDSFRLTDAEAKGPLKAITIGTNEAISAEEIMSSLPLNDEIVISSSVNNSPLKDTLFPAKSPRSSDIVKIDSSPLKPSAPLRSEFKTPTKPKKVFDSLQETPTATGKVTAKFQVSPLKLTPPDLSSTQSNSVYSTAKENFDVRRNSLHGMLTPKRKRFHTRVIEVNGDVEIREVENPRMKIRKIGNKSIGFSDDVVEASDYEDNEISIIEITTEIEESPDAAQNVSTVQVPSSPGILNLDLAASVHSDHSVFNGADSEFTTMPTQELRGLFKEWGLKPVKGRKKMIEVLENASQVLEENAGLPPATQVSQLSQAEFNSMIFAKLHTAIKGSKEWFNKIITYEPLSLQQLKRWLDSETSIRLEIDMLAKYCDEHGICYSSDKDD